MDFSIVKRKFPLNYAQILGRKALSGAVVNLKQGTFKLTSSAFKVKSCRKLCFEFVDDYIGFHTQNRMDNARHSDVGDISGPLWQNFCVRGLDMSMSAKQSGYSAVKIITHRALFAGCLGMKIHNNYLTLGFLKHVVDHIKGTVKSALSVNIFPMRLMTVMILLPVSILIMPLPGVVLSGKFAGRAINGLLSR